MVMIDQLFVLIVKFSALTFVLTGAGVMTLRFFKQPVERIRLIQVTLASVLAATLIGQINWLPSLELAWLPGDEQRIEGSTAKSPTFTVATSEPRVGSGLADSTSLDGPIGPTNPVTDEAATFLPVTDDTAADALVTRFMPWAFFKSTIVIGFVVISGVQAVYFLLGYILTYRLVASAAPLAPSDSSVANEFREELAGGRVRLLKSERISVPIASGILTPTIVLPKQLLCGEVDPLQVRHSLDHEWKHIERRDLVTWQLTSVCQILLWPQPFYWRLRRELRVSQDQIADQFATRRSQQPVAYATTLVEFAKARHSALLGALTMSGAKSNLFRRVEMLLNADFNVAGLCRRRIVLGFAGMMAAASILLASLQLGYATVDSNAKKPSGDQTGAQRDKPRQPATPQDNATAPAEHTGFVFDAFDEKPVANATVTVTRMRSDTWEEIAVTECQTDADGRFIFSIPAEQLNLRYLYIMFDLRHATYAPRHCGSYSYAMILKNQELGAEPWFKKLQMVPGKKLSGRCVDEEGEPVAGAAIRVKSEAPSVEGFAGHSSTDTMTGEDGRFEAIVTEKGNASVSVIPIEHCMTHVDLGKKRGDIGDLTLARGVSISGSVLNAVGEPLEGLWVNLTDMETQREASYEAKRSSKTNSDGQFQTRPLRPGKYEVSVETKATGALEKKKYANFDDTPPPAMFVRRTIEVTRGSIDKPFVIQAVPHVYIKGQCYNPEGEITRCHFPTVSGRFNGQFMWIHAKNGKQVGEFELMVPHGVESAQLRFTTNEHSALTIQLPGQPPSPQREFAYPTIEEDITGIKVVRYVAPILQVKVVDETGQQVTDARVSATYPRQDQAELKMMGESTLTRSFEKQENGIYRSSSLVPEMEFEVFARKNGFESERKRMSMREGHNDTMTIALKPVNSDSEEENNDAIGEFKLR